MKAAVFRGVGDVGFPIRVAMKQRTVGWQKTEVMSAGAA